MSIETMLHEKIAKDFENLKTMEVGSEEYRVTSDTLTKFMDRAIEMEKVHVEKEDKEESRENDKNLKLEQMKDDRKDRLVRNIITGVNVAGGFGLAIWGTLKSLKFEETGTITTWAGKKFISKLFSGGK